MRKGHNQQVECEGRANIYSTTSPFLGLRKGFIRENGLLLASQRILVHLALHSAFNSTRPVLSFTDTVWKIAGVFLLHRKLSVLIRG
jgi:hypothetical protein